MSTAYSQSTSAILDELNYRSYCQQRMLAPHVPPERWVKIFPEWAAFEERFVHQFVSCLMLAAEDFEGLPTTDGTKPSAQMAQGADIGKSGEVSTASPLQQDSCGTVEKQLKGHGMEGVESAGTGEGCQSLKLQARICDPAQLEARPSSGYQAPPAGVFSIYHPQRGGNSDGLHVTQAASRESDRHPASSETLDRTQERNGCVAKTDMPRTDAPPADVSRASASIFSGTTIEDIDARVIRLMQKVGRA